jgi:hypothetical protein
MMNKKNKIVLFGFLILISILLFVSSCEDETSKTIKNLGKQKTPEVWVKFDFPDTVYRNKSYNGKIEFKSILDTITTNVLEENNGKNRYIIFSLIKTKDINYDIKQLKKIKLDTFGALSNRVIPISDIKFTELGTNYIDGILNDQAVIDDITKNKNAKNRVRIIENEVRATHKVVVIENPR